MVDNYYIGIKIADGSFYPILDSSEKKSKKLVLTTVKDNQEKVQIDLYRGAGKELSEARYIGSLIIENINPAPKGEPEIELVIGIDENGNLNATAHDVMTGEKQTLSVSLESLSEEMTYEVPDFDLGGEFEGEMEAELGEGLGSALPEDEAGGINEPEPEEISLTGETYPVGERDRRKEHIEKRKKSPLLLVLFIILGLLIVGAAAYLIFVNLHGEEVPPLIGGSKTTVIPSGSKAETQTPVPTKEKPKQVSNTEKKTQTEEQSGTGVDTGGKKKPQTGAVSGTSPGGIWYTIKRGDTLWDISSTYYRNPWLFPKIARANRIKNPDLIFAGAKIFIPKQ